MRLSERALFDLTARPNLRLPGTQESDIAGFKNTTTVSLNERIRSLI